MMRTLLKQNLLYILAIYIAGLFFFSSCGGETKSAVNFSYDPEIIPTISTDSVTTLISDSGIIRYKLVTPTWDMFEDAKEKFWYFPNGIYLEQFDTVFNVVLSVKADTAWNFVHKNLWKLRGNVHIQNHESDFIYISEEFFWDRDKREVYSNLLVFVDQKETGRLYGEGFVSDDRLINPVFRNIGRYPKGKTEVFVKENEQGEEKVVEEKTE